MKRYFLILIVLMSVGGVFASGNSEDKSTPAVQTEPAVQPEPAAEPVSIRVMAPSGTPRPGHVRLRSRGQRIAARLYPRDRGC